jgi:hypothetical protein
VIGVVNGLRFVVMGAGIESGEWMDSHY